MPQISQISVVEGGRYTARLVISLFSFKFFCLADTSLLILLITQQLNESNWY